MRSSLEHSRMDRMGTCRKSPPRQYTKAGDGLTRRDFLSILACAPLCFLGELERPGTISELSTKRAMFARKVSARLP
jgi:hypothetical protein